MLHSLYAGTKEKAGLLDRYFSLSERQHASLEDIRLGADLVRVGDQMLCLHTLSDTDASPQACIPMHAMNDFLPTAVIAD